MTRNKTLQNSGSVEAFLHSVAHPTRRADGLRLREIFQQVSGFAPVMWGASMVGFGRYHYVYASGREGDSFATGFSPRKANLSLHIMPGYQDFGEIMARLGKHKTGAACVYVNKLADIDEGALRELIQAGLERLDRIWPVSPS